MYKISIIFQNLREETENILSENKNNLKSYKQLIENGDLYKRIEGFLINNNEKINLDVLFTQFVVQILCYIAQESYTLLKEVRNSINTIIEEINAELNTNVILFKEILKEKEVWFNDHLNGGDVDDVNKLERNINELINKLKSLIEKRVELMKDIQPLKEYEGKFTVMKIEIKPNLQSLYDTIKNISVYIFSNIFLGE